MKKKIFAFTAAACLAAISLSACDSNDKGTITPADSTQSDAADKDDAKEPEKQANPTFGDTYTWPDGLAVTLSQPEEFTPSEYAYGHEEGNHAVKFEVTIHNGTDKDVEAIGLSLTAASDGKEGEAIFDSSNGIETPTSTILPGKDLTWTEAFSVKDPSDIQVSVTNAFDFDSAKVHFTN